MVSVTDLVFLLFVLRPGYLVMGVMVLVVVGVMVLAVVVTPRPHPGAIAPLQSLPRGNG